MFTNFRPSLLVILEYYNLCDISLWNRRTQADKICCIGLVTISVLCLLIFVVIISIVLLTSGDCTTEECIRTASAVLKSMDRSVDPCKNFYKFACGSFIKNSKIPDDLDSIDEYATLEVEIRKQLKTLVMKEPRKNDPRPYKFVNNLFKACMNEELIEKRGIEPMTALAESLGGWPVIKGDKWKESSWEWQKTIQKFHKLGFNVDCILRVTIDIHIRDINQRILYLNQFADVNPMINEDYLNYMIDIAIMFGADPGKAKNELNEVFEFEKSLYKICFIQNTLAGPPPELYVYMTLNEVQKKYSYINWLDYINSILPKGLQVNSQELVMVVVPKYFEQLGPLLDKTPKRVIANYLMWKIHEFSAIYLTRKLRNRRHQYEESGQKKQTPRTKECFEITQKKLLTSVAALFIREYFPKSAQNSALSMFNSIHKEFENILLESAWMDEKTRKYAISKLKKLHADIGGSGEMKDTTKLEKYHEDLEINANRYLESILKANAFHTNNYFKQFRESVRKTDWYENEKPFQVNGYYVPSKNSLIIPAGMFYGKFFNYRRPQYMNYGAVGWIIGHEITHGFDEAGAQFDGNGKHVDWWHQKTKKLFLEKTECITQQYGNFTDKVTGLKLNGNSTLNENIADNGGIKVSYRAYESWLIENGKELRLPGLNYTSEQMFWISAAQNWCSKSTPEYMKKYIRTNTHTLPEFRILGTMKNSKEFSKDFNCPKGSPMNPVKKCRVW